MILTDDTFVQYAMKHYSNPSCKTIAEFENDVQRFISIKKLLNREEHDVDLALNHIRIQFNVFDMEACREMMFFRCYKYSWPSLKTYLLFLNYMPSDMLVDVELNQIVVDKLRRI